MPDLSISNPPSLTPHPFGHPLYACLYQPPAPERHDLVAIAQEFSPRYERHRSDLVSIDVSGLGRLLGPARVIGEELRREAAARGARLHVAIAGTRMTALLIAVARPGLTIVEAGGEAEALAPVAVGILERISDPATSFAVLAFKRWGLKTLGELAALRAADLVARLGRQSLKWQAMARGEDIRPLVPTLEEERFESSMELDWPIDGLEPLSFVLTRLLEPLSTRLERRDRGAAVLHVLLRLVTRDPSTLREPRGGPERGRGTTGSGWEETARRLELPTPIRDVRTLRTLALLDLESHPPAAAIDRVAIVIDPTPGRVLQHTLFTRAHPTPEQLSTLLARLGALMGQDRFGTPAVVDTYRPGAFAMAAFATAHTHRRAGADPRVRPGPTHGSAPTPIGASAGFAFDRREPVASSPEPSGAPKPRSGDGGGVASALRRCRQPVPARVAVAEGRPVRVTTDRRGFAGGAVTSCAGPWKTSGDWWSGGETHQTCWSRDEWDVALKDGAVYRIFRDHTTEAWFIDAIVD